MADQTVASLTDRLADYLVNAFTDGRGYDPADPVDVAVTLKDGFAIVLAEMREDQDAGSATYLRADALIAAGRLSARMDALDAEEDPR